MISLWKEALAFGIDQGWAIPRLLVDLVQEGVNLEAFAIRETSVSSRAEECAGEHTESKGVAVVTGLGEPRGDSGTSTEDKRPEKFKSLADQPAWMSYLERSAQQGDVYEEGLRAWRNNPKGTESASWVESGFQE